MTSEIHPRPTPVARIWHGLTLVVALAALVLQFVLVLRGGHVLGETTLPPTGERVLNYFSYFTIQSNILVAVTAWTLVAGRDTDRTWWRVVRLNAVVGISITGLVVWLILAPWMKKNGMGLHGADLLADRLLHVVVPLLAVIGFVVFGPRKRVSVRDLLLTLVWPLAWIGYTLIHGVIADWYPYPFVDVAANGYPRVLLNCLGIAVLLLVVTGVLLLLGRWRLTRVARGQVSYSPR
ncbi:Pr6Pr family membrane protein [Nakamurella lactea]|uniref:Pr6Pr family membrane protein n=1 Tax=Nakamurella lactea TaxID=459515 RepID=UPI0003F90481|nr:Pr6Pr family membrane protein [Nakamurella lactea]